MLSRVANSIYWMSRYIERAQSVARIVEVIRLLLLDLPDENPEHQWWSLINATGDQDDFHKRYGQATQANATRFLTFDRENPNSLAASLDRARENARSVREIISSDMWEQINRSYWMLKEAEATRRVETEPAEFFSHFRKACHLFEGITDSTMTHSDGWHFARMGRLIERADKTSRILDVKYFILLPRLDYVGSPYDSLQWAALLRCISALEMYRKRFKQIAPEHVADFLVLDRQFPRSIRYCVTMAEHSLHEITGTPVNTFTNSAEQRLGRFRSELDFTSIADIFTLGLHEYLDQVQARLNEAGAGIHETFFAPRNEPSRAGA